MTNSQHFVFALIEDFTHLAFSCAVEPLRIANLISGKELYRWSFASANGKIATCSNGAVTLVHHRFEKLPSCDRLFVLSGINITRQDTRTLLKVLRRERARGTKIGALCSGAYILAKAGFLKGMQAAIHWEYYDSFKEEFPDVNLVRNVFVADEKFVTASGGTAAADLMLNLIERDHGYSLAVAIADQMIFDVVRNATAAQHVSLPSRKGLRSKHLVASINLMQKRIENPVLLSTISLELGVSVRQLERLFGKYLNTSPKKYFMELRLNRARKLLLQTQCAIGEVALACGFENSAHFSRVYRASYGVSPMMQRGPER